MKEELKQIIHDLQETIGETALNISDEIVLDCAIRIYNSKHIPGNATRRPNAGRFPNATAPATPAQVGLLKKLGAPTTYGLTKAEASKMIDSLNRNQGDAY